MNVTAWHHVAIPVPDLQRSVDWYERVLGGTVYRRTDVDAADIAAGRNPQVWMNVGETIVNLAQSPPVTRAPEQHFFHYAVSADSADFDDWLTHLAQHGVTILGPYGHGGLPILSLYFDDPDSYRWELVFGFPDYESAKQAAFAHGGRLGNPTAAYDWD